MRTFRSFDDLQSAVGAEVGTSEWVEVTQDRIDKFAAATGDDQWIHVDVSRAARELPSAAIQKWQQIGMPLLPRSRAIFPSWTY